MAQELFEICEKFFDELGNWIVRRMDCGYTGDDLCDEASKVSDAVEELMAAADEEREAVHEYLKHRTRYEMARDWNSR